MKVLERGKFVSETTKAVLEIAKAISEIAKAISEIAKATSEIAKATSEIAKATSEIAKATSETTKATSEIAKATSEIAKATSETTKATSEIAKATSETTKAISEIAKAILFEDTAAVLGLFVALIGIFLGHLFNNVYFDGIASIIIGIILAIVAILLARESKGLLLGESANPQTIASIRSLSKTESGVQEVIRILTMQLAPQEVLLNLEIQFAKNLTGEQIALTVESLEAKISQKHPEIKQIFIEAKSLAATRKYPQPLE
ncbi:cation transporter [Nostoc sp.]|uniref:cation transporter n=1 Tax=Nostoc sp. TaxID=1180 RepID=UPI002FFCEFEE